MPLQPELQLRRMVQDDLQAVHRLELSSQPHPWSLKQFEEELVNPVSVVDLCCCEGHVAGFLCSWLIAGELQIQNLATAPDFRRRGIMHSLLGAVLERGREAGMVSAWLEVRVSNEPAITLYEQFGFQEVDRRPGYYTDGEDALIMAYHVESGRT